MNKFQNGKIYKLVCDASPLVYYGSTIKSLNDRLATHKNDWLRRGTGGSAELFDLGNVTIHLIKNFPCNSKEELEKEEGLFIKVFLKCFPFRIIVNRRIPRRYKNDYDKEYYIENKDKLLKGMKTRKEKKKEEINLYLVEYRKKNKEQLHKYANTVINCVCGSNYTRSNKIRHLKSKKHLNYVKQLGTN